MKNLLFPIDSIVVRIKKNTMRLAWCSIFKALSSDLFGPVLFGFGNELLQFGNTLGIDGVRA